MIYSVLDWSVSKYLLNNSIGKMIGCLIDWLIWERFVVLNIYILLSLLVFIKNKKMKNTVKWMIFSNWIMCFVLEFVVDYSREFLIYFIFCTDFIKHNGMAKSWKVLIGFVWIVPAVNAGHDIILVHKEFESNAHWFHCDLCLTHDDGHCEYTKKCNDVSESENTASTIWRVYIFGGLSISRSTIEPPRVFELIHDIRGCL